MATPTSVAGAFSTISGGTSGSFNLDCGSGANRCVYVTVSGQNTSNPVSSITVGGLVCSLVDFQSLAGLGCLATYRRLAPATGTQSVSVTLASADYCTIGADSWSDVSQSTPDGTVAATSSSSNATPTTTVTGTTAGNVVRAAANLYLGAWGYVAGQTQLWKNIASWDQSGGAEYTSAGGDKTMTWTGDSTKYIQHAFEIFGASSGHLCRPPSLSNSGAGQQAFNPTL